MDILENITIYLNTYKYTASLHVGFYDLTTNLKLN